jgi:hypothetical protein
MIRSPRANRWRSAAAGVAIAAASFTAAACGGEEPAEDTNIEDVEDEGGEEGEGGEEEDD